MSQAGVQFVRFDFDWKDIEPSNDTFAFASYDNIVSKLKQQGIKILGILDYDNTWSDPKTGNATEINHFADFAYNTVKHFKNDIKYWQVWNEPNNVNFWTSPNAQNYTKLLKKAYAAVKQGNPNAVVVLGGLMGNGIEAYNFLGIDFAIADFLSDIYSNGGRDYFDVASIHPYNYATDVTSTVSMEAAMDAARTLMNNNGDSAKELWVTELGPLRFPPTAYPFISSRGYSEAEVADWLTLIYTNLSSKCNKLFWYELRDHPTQTLGEFYWEGLVQKDYTQKQAYTTYKNLPK